MHDVPVECSVVNKEWNWGCFIHGDTGLQYARSDTWNKLAPSPYCGFPHVATKTHPPNKVRGSSHSVTFMWM